MKGAKAVNLVSRIVRIIGIVLIVISLVLFLYAVINTGSRWGELSADMDSFDVKTNIFDRLRFDDQLFTSMSNTVRKNVELELGLNDTPTPQQQEALDAEVSPQFDEYYQRAKDGLTAHYANETEEVRAWFANEFDTAAFIQENSNIELILQSHEIAEILEYLKELYVPKKVTMAKPEQATELDKAYKDYRSTHGKDAGSRFEFYSTIKLLVDAEIESGTYSKNKTTAQWWNASVTKDDFDARYQEALAQVRLQESREGDDNFIVQLMDLAQRKENGETVEYNSLLDDVYNEVLALDPSVDYGDPHIFFLAAKELTQSILPQPQEEETEAEPSVMLDGTAPEEAPGAEGENAGEEAPAEGEASETEEATEEEEEWFADSDSEEEEFLDEDDLDPNRFDGSYVSIRDKMKALRAEEDKNNPDARETIFVETVVKDARDRASIGSLVVTFWALVAKYVYIFLAGLALVILAAIARKLMQRVLLSRKDDKVDGTDRRAADAEGAAPEQPEAFGDDVLLRVSHLKQYFRSGNYVNKAVDDISFYVKKGEVFGLVGESGCGKTTTGRTIINLYDPTEGDVYFEGLRISSNLNGLPVLKKSLHNDANLAIMAEEAALKEAIAAHPDEEAKLKAAFKQKCKEIRSDLKVKTSNASTNALISFVEKGKAINRYRARRQEELTAQFEADQAGLSGEALEKRKADYKRDMKVASKDNIMSKMQMIFQDPIASINPRMTVREIIAEGLIIQGVKDKEYINERVNEMLELVGLVREHADRYPHEFSGGQRQRIGIARAIIMNPDLIIADEPISALDVSIQAQVINLLNDLRNRMGLTIMFIAHNLSVVKYFSDRIAVMYYGKIVEMTTSDELFAHPLHPYTKSLLSAIPYPDPHYEKARKRIEYNPAKAHDYSVDKPRLREITPGHYIYCNEAEFAQYLKELGL